MCVCVLVWMDDDDVDERLYFIYYFSKNKNRKKICGSKAQKVVEIKKNCLFFKFFLHVLFYSSNFLYLASFTILQAYFIFFINVCMAFA